MLLPPALATGRLTIVTDAMAREVTVDESGLRERRHLHRQDHRPREPRARPHRRARGERVRVGAASAQLEVVEVSAGLANSSGVVGRYLTDSTGTSVRGFIPRMMNSVPHNEDGASGSHLYMPWWLDNRKLDFPRGYHIEIGGGRRMPGFGTFDGIHRYTAGDSGRPISGGGYGKQLKDDYRRFYGATVGFSGPRRDGPERGLLLRDRSRRRRSVGHSGAALPLQVVGPRAQAGQAHAGDLPRHHRARWAARRSSPMPTEADGYGIEPGGRIIHEIGVTRMGNDPSVGRQQNCQAHDVKNLFVADGGPFVSKPDKNVDVDDPRAGDAHQRIHRRAAEGRESESSGKSRC